MPLSLSPAPLTGSLESSQRRGAYRPFGTVRFLGAYQGLLAGAAALFLAPVLVADTEDAQRWLSEFQPSTLTQTQQLDEMQWFIDAARPFAGMEIKVVSETITTNE